MNEKKNAQVSFEDTAIAFRQKSDRELFLSFLIFWLTKSPFLVKFLSRAARFSLAIGLPIKPLIKSTVFKQFCGGETKAEYTKVIDSLAGSSIGTILDYAVEGIEDEDGFEATKQELIHIIRQSRSNPDIPCTCMKMSAIGSSDLFQKITSGEELSDTQDREWLSLKRRLGEICAAAHQSDKPIYIDAEESWVQGAMDSLAEEMMAKYNTAKAIVFTTLQMYRWDRIDYLKQLITDAESGSYRLGIKFVRGAYLEKERERALLHGYASPINATKEDTDRDFDEAVRLSMEHIDVVEICVGTHNEKSCRLMVDHMREHELPNNHPHIYFSQLFGMSDNISFNLAHAGYNVSKYLPFGPLESTLPYLTRRAEENTAIAGQMSKELEVIIKERERRKAART
jgi:proline dehydrogenase